MIHINDLHLLLRHLPEHLQLLHQILPLTIQLRQRRIELLQQKSQLLIHRLHKRLRRNVLLNLEKGNIDVVPYNVTIGPWLHDIFQQGDLLVELRSHLFDNILLLFVFEIFDLG